MRAVRARFGNLPTDKAPLRTRFSRITVARRIARRHCALVSSNDFRSRTRLPDLAAVQPVDALAKPANLVHLVAYEDDRASALRNFLHLAETFLLKFEVADGEHFIDE